VTEPQAKFRTGRKKRGPSWLNDEEGELVGYSLDIVKDAFEERAMLGLLARYPQQGPDGTPGPTDALAAIGRDRRVIKGLDETDANYAIRLRKYLDDRKTAGNPFTLMQRLAEYMGPLPKIRTVDNAGNWYTREANGTRSALLKQANWVWDDHTRWWSRFWVIIYPNGLWTQVDDWGDAGLQWGEEGHTWGTSATPEQVATVKFLVNDWKPAGTRCINIIIAFDNASFDPTATVDATGMPNGLWERWGKTVDGVCVPARLTTARYCDGK
jgi:hypothetical protein